MRTGPGAEPEPEPEPEQRPPPPLPPPPPPPLQQELMFTEEDAQLSFKLFDADGNGYISAAELTHVMTTLGDERLAPHEVAAMIAEADERPTASAVGRIDYEQYKCLVLNETKSLRWKTALQKKLQSISDQGGLLAGSTAALRAWAPLRSETLTSGVREFLAKRSRFLKTTSAPGDDGSGGSSWQWVHDEVTVRIDLSEPFAKGAMRECYRMKKMSTHLSAEDFAQQRPATLWKHQRCYVAKRYMDLPPHRVKKVLYGDVKMQMCVLPPPPPPPPPPAPRLARRLLKYKMLLLDPIDR
jgi:hypothetical protein